MNTFVEQFSILNKQLKAGGTSSFVISGLAAGEQLIVANGEFGKVSTDSRLAEGLIAEIETLVKHTDKQSTLLILAREGRVVAQKKISADNLIANFVPVKNNIKVVEGSRELDMECVARPQSDSGRKSELWNETCYGVLADPGL